MITNVNYSNGDRNNIVSYLKNMKETNPDYKIIDVGGTYEGWSWSLLDAIVDINECKDKSIKQFQFNICDHDSWGELLEYVDKNGKFDFVICSHTLEDISNPLLVTQQLTKIAKAGYIAIPSKFIELSKNLKDINFEILVSDNRFRGYMHHRWIFQIEDGEFVGYPKLPFLEADTFFDGIAKLDLNIRDLSFIWTDKIELKIVNNDFMGPGSQSIVNMFRVGLSKNN
jgi:hypothetical protein